MQMQEHLLIIFDKESYFYIFETEDVMEYYNYLANVYRQIEHYKQNFLNYIEYVITKGEIQIYVESNDLTVKDLQDNIDLVLEVPIEDMMPKDRTFPKVPDYLLKQTSYLILPIEMATKTVNNVPLFDTYKMSEETVEELHKVFNQYCFSEKEYNEYRPSIAKGQKLSISENLISVNTFLDNDYDVRFENELLNNKKLEYKDSKYDDLFILEKEDRVFVSKILSVFYQGSFYEYRNFLYRNPSVLFNIAKLLEDDFHKQTGLTDVEFRPLLDRFILLDNIDNAYSRILDSIPNLGFFKDVDKVEFKLPSNVHKINPKELKYKNGNIAISNFVTGDKKEVATKEQGKTTKPTNKTAKKPTSKKKDKTNMDIERMRKIHEKKFPNLPFFLDEKTENKDESEE